MSVTVRNFAQALNTMILGLFSSNLSDPEASQNLNNREASCVTLDCPFCFCG